MMARRVRWHHVGIATCLTSWAICLVLVFLMFRMVV